MHALDERRAALAMRIGIGGIQPIAIPARKLGGIALANLVGRQSFEIAKINFDEFFDQNWRGCR